MIIPNDEVRRPSGPRRLVFAGEAIVDVVMRIPALPPRGGDVLAESSEVTAGGGVNVMAAAARQGLPVRYAGGHGTGPWGDVIRAALAAEGVGLVRAADPDRDTGFDVAFVEPDAERTFVTHLGAEAVRGPAAWDEVPTEPGDAVYVSGYGLVAPDSGQALGDWAAALPSGVLLFVDPGPMVAQIPAAVLDPVLARCDWLSCNQREAAFLAGIGPAGTERSGTGGSDTGPSSTGPSSTGGSGTGGSGTGGSGTGPVDTGLSGTGGSGTGGSGTGGSGTGGSGTGGSGTGPADTGPSGTGGSDTGAADGPGDPAEAARRLLARGAAANVLVRAGAAGCYAALPAYPDAVHVRAPRVNAVDTTGAGDAHSGAFLAALAEGLSPLGAVARANAAAAFAVTRPGPATSPTRAQLDAWINDAPD
jgi:sugar/nucleoside kinase (ribokinase family)